MYKIKINFKNYEAAKAIYDYVVGSESIYMTEDGKLKTLTGFDGAVGFIFITQKRLFRKSLKKQIGYVTKITQDAIYIKSETFTDALMCNSVIKSILETITLDSMFDNIDYIQKA